MARAKAELYRFVIHNQLTHFGTLTNREEIYSWREISRRVRKFLERMSADGYRIPIALVAEPMPGGHGWHVHFCFPFFISERRFRSWWPMKRYGNLDLQGPKQKGRAPRKNAGYMVKYLGKQLEAEELAGCEPRPAGAHRYWKTQGFEPVPTERGFSSWAELQAWLLRHYGRPERIDWWKSEDGYRPEGCCLRFPDSCIRAPPRTLSAAGPVEGPAA